MCKFVFTALGLVVLFGLTPVWADHGAPAPQLGGVTFCLDAASVQLETEGVVFSPVVRQRVRQKVLGMLQTRLKTRNVPYTTDCSAARSYVLLSLYVRFLDPQTYVGFPEHSYTYVTSAQVGRTVKGAGAETVLPERIYSASASDIFQAATPQQLEQRLVALGEAEAVSLTKTWLEANAVTLRSYLVFTALGLSLIALRGLTFIFR